METQKADREFCTKQILRNQGFVLASVLAFRGFVSISGKMEFHDVQPTSGPTQLSRVLGPTNLGSLKAVWRSANHFHVPYGKFNVALPSTDSKTLSTAKKEKGARV